MRLLRRERGAYSAALALLSLLVGLVLVLVEAVDLDESLDEVEGLELELDELELDELESDPLLLLLFEELLP